MSTSVHKALALANEAGTTSLKLTLGGKELAKGEKVERDSKLSLLPLQSRTLLTSVCRSASTAIP